MIKRLQREEVTKLKEHYTAKGIKDYLDRHYLNRGDNNLGEYGVCCYLGLLSRKMCDRVGYPVKPGEKCIGYAWQGFYWVSVYDRITQTKNGSINAYRLHLIEHLKQYLPYTKEVQGIGGERVTLQDIKGEIKDVNNI